jgi:tetratricopeptide (TPR) repeat protein
MLNGLGADLADVFTELIGPGLGLEAYESGDYATAAGEFEAVAQATSGTKCVTFYGLAARCWIRCKKKDRAVRALKMADRIASRTKDPAMDGLGPLMVFQLALEGDKDCPFAGPQTMPRLEEERLAYEALAEAGHHDLGPRSTANLAVLEYRQGNVACAQRLLGQALASTSRTARVQAAYNLGALAEERGERGPARRYYWRAAWSRGNREFSRRARRKLFHR